MSHTRDLECRGYYLQETALAVQVRPMNKGLKHPTNYWIPRSQISYLRKEAVVTWKMGMDTPQYYVIFNMPEWLIEKNGYWDLVP